MGLCARLRPLLNRTKPSLTFAGRWGAAFLTVVGLYDTVGSQLLPADWKQHFPTAYGVISRTTGFFPWWTWLFLIALWLSLGHAHKAFADRELLAKLGQLETRHKFEMAKSKRTSDLLSRLQKLDRLLMDIDGASEGLRQLAEDTDDCFPNLGVASMSDGIRSVRAFLQERQDELDKICFEYTNAYPDDDLTVHPSDIEAAIAKRMAEARPSPGEEESALRDACAQTATEKSILTQMRTRTLSERNALLR